MWRPEFKSPELFDALIDNITKTKLEEVVMVILGLYFTQLSITEGQGMDSNKQELEAETMEECCSLAGSLVHTYKDQTHLTRGVATHSRMDTPLSITHKINLSQTWLRVKPI